MNSSSPVRMRAAVLRAPGQVEVDDFPIPDLQHGEVLVRMTRASICGSDLHVVYDGFARTFEKPGYPGHEGIGVVLESRSDSFREGQVVLTVPTGVGGQCFASHQVVPEAFLVPLPDDADQERLLFAQQLGTTIYAMRKFWPRDPATGDTPPGLEPLEPRCAVVIGAGSAGLFFVQLARHAGFERIVVSDPTPERRQLARELGATEVTDGGTEQLVEATLTSSAARGADLVIEAAGYDLCRDQAIQAVRPRGRVGCFGYPERPGWRLSRSSCAFGRHQPSSSPWAPSASLSSAHSATPSSRSGGAPSRSTTAGGPASISSRRPRRSRWRSRAGRR